VRLGKRLKKNNIAVDIVNFGEEAENTEKLEAFTLAVNSNENSHLVTVPPGPHILSDILISSPIISGDNEGGSSTIGGVSSGTNDFGSFGGVDPNLEPELALALKVSMEEERARQEERRKAETQTESKVNEVPVSTQPPEVEMTEAADDDEELLQQAIALSMQQEKQTAASEVVSAPSITSSAIISMEDDEEMRLAMQMSLGSPQQANASGEDIGKELMEDANFVNSILMSLPGVNPDDDRIKNALKQLEQKKDKDK